MTLAIMNVTAVVSLRGLPAEEIDEALRTVQLDGQVKKPVNHFSLGMKQRLGIAAAVMEHPDLILLDEPTNALDESGVDMLGDIVKKEKERGAVLIVSSHDRDILEDISDEIYDLEQGEIVRHSIKGEKRSEG
jgi:ABC-2 type transport system ATP-binding protein